MIAVTRFVRSALSAELSRSFVVSFLSIARDRFFPLEHSQFSRDVSEIRDKRDVTGVAVAHTRDPFRERDINGTRRRKFGIFSKIF